MRHLRVYLLGVPPVLLVCLLCAVQSGQSGVNPGAVPTNSADGNVRQPPEAYPQEAWLGAQQPRRLSEEPAARHRDAVRCDGLRDRACCESQGTITSSVNVIYYLFSFHNSPRPRRTEPPPPARGNAGFSTRSATSLTTDACATAMIVRCSQQQRNGSRVSPGASCGKVDGT